MALLDDILPIVIPIAFVAVILVMLDKKFHIFGYIGEYGSRLWDWLKSGAR